MQVFVPGTCKNPAPYFAHELPLSLFCCPAVARGISVFPFLWSICWAGAVRSGKKARLAASNVLITGSLPDNPAQRPLQLSLILNV